MNSPLLQILWLTTAFTVAAAVPDITHQLPPRPKAYKSYTPKPYTPAPYHPPSPTVGKTSSQLYSFLTVAKSPNHENWIIVKVAVLHTNAVQSESFYPMGL